MIKCFVTLPYQLVTHDAKALLVPELSRFDENVKERAALNFANSRWIAAANKFHSTIKHVNNVQSNQNNHDVKQNAA